MTVTGIGTEHHSDDGRRPAVGDELSPVDAARRLFATPRAQVEFTARDEGEARSAVEEFAHLFETAAGVFKEALNGARAGAETLSGDRLQGLAEIIQNADDTAASYVEFRVIDGHLVAAHDGRLVTLSDVLSLATPWLSNKTDNVLATGRFGIGLMTLRALSDVLDVHSGHYHVRLGDPTISSVDLSALPAPLSSPDATVLCLPLREALSTDDVSEWLARWDDSALLFLRHVERVTVVDTDGAVVRTLELTWSEDEPTSCLVEGNKLPIRRRHAQAPDGRTWLAHSTEAPTPAGVSRVRKASAPTVPLGLALALHPGDRGLVYAGLPVVATGVPLRVNAQFDPVTSRTGLAPTAWNRAMLPLLADLWLEVVENLFGEMPAVAWAAVPLPADVEAGDNLGSVVDQLERLILDRARTELANRAAVAVNDEAVALTALAVEDPRLEGVLDPAEVAALAGLRAALPPGARDADGRWRAILDDWRSVGAPLPPPVTVDSALTLIDDPARGAEATIRLTAVALDAGRADRLLSLACVMTDDGNGVPPPMTGSLHVLLVAPSTLARQLGIGVRLAEAHLAETESAERVLKWLRQIGAVIEDVDNEQVVRRLAAAGAAGNYLTDPLTDEQLRSLRDAFEQLPQAERVALGRNVGQAITIAAYGFDARGQTVHTHARPVDLYLSRAIDREADSFAVAADRTPGLLWTHNRYADQLRSGLGRSGGLGPQKFLGLLGAERAPRIVPHSALYRRYASDRREGLAAAVNGSPPQRDRELRRMGASYTLDDVDSPDLRNVAINIAAEPKVTRRRGRAGALLAGLGRVDRFQESGEVDAADDYNGWQIKGTTRAFWLWSVGAIPWLDDTDGVPQPPLDLRLRTPATIAVHGADAAGYLRPEFDAPNRRDVLAALGVAGDPSTRDLVSRLRLLRDTTPAPDTVATDAAIVYQALADRIVNRTVVPGDLSERDLRTAFGEGVGLILTDLGWRPPTEVLVGSPIFRGRRAFVPQVPRAERLWSLLRIRQPSLDDCLRVIGQVARTRRPPQGDDVAILLETLRLLSRLVAGTPELNRNTARRLGSLSLFTTRGWTTERPIYAIDDPALIEGLRAELPIWDAGGEITQFASLFGPLRVVSLGPDATTVVDPGAAQPDGDATELLASAVALLQDDLVRNEPTTAAALSITWDRLRRFEVRVDPDLRVVVEAIAGRPPLTVDVATKADVTRDVLFLRDARLLRQVEIGGRAIAGLFSTADRRQLAQAWLAACVAADEGRQAQRLELAEQQARQERARREQEMAERAAALGEEISGRHDGRARRRHGRPTGTAPGAPASGSPTQPAPSPAPAPQSPPRVLVDPSTLVVTNPDGTPQRSGTERPTRGRGASSSSHLPSPNRGVGSPRGSTAPPGFTPLDKESIGLELAWLVLGGDDTDLVDLRAQHGVGADAIDRRDRFFELKVHLGDEPDTVRLEESQIRRALSTPNFFLVVVSNIEGVNAKPKVRIIVDPVHQLVMTESSSINFSGVRSAEHSLVYNLEQQLPEAPDDAQ